MRRVMIALVLFVAASAVCGVAEAQQCTLTNITETLPPFHVNTPANFQIEVCCGTPPYRFEILGDPLPEGLHLSQNGKITGKPRVEAETTVLILISDAGGCSFGITFPVFVFAEP